jgi:hypothetical protein
MHVGGNISVAVLLESLGYPGPRGRRGVEPIGVAPIRLADEPFRWRSRRRAHSGTGMADSLLTIASRSFTSRLICCMFHHHA